MAWPILAAGIGSMIAGGILAGNAADAARKRLEDVALTPGVDVDAATLQSLLTMEKYLPRAQGIGSSLGDYYATELEKYLEKSQPGYAERRKKVLANVDEWLAGKLPEDVVSEIYRTTAGKALRGGYSGTGIHASSAARTLGLNSLGLQQYATGVMPQLSSMFPAAGPVDISGLTGLTPTQLINLRSGERAQQMALMAQQAIMPGQTGIWANNLTQWGGMLLGSGLMGGMGGGGMSGAQSMTGGVGTSLGPVLGMMSRA